MSEYYIKTFSTLSNSNFIFSEQEKILRLNESKPTIGELRESFKKFPCYVDYSNPKVRGAYLLAYYPYYIAPVKKVLKKIIPEFPSIASNGILKVSAFGCGAAPEVIGISEYFDEAGIAIKKMENNLLDFEEGWKKSRDELIKAFLKEKLEYTNIHQKCNILDDCKNCCSGEICQKNLKNSHIVVIQNCLNDVSAKMKKEKLSYILKNYLHAEGILILIDLNFSEIRELMFTLEKELKDKILMKTTKFSEEAKFKIPELIETHIFDGQNNFIPKRHTHFYSVVFKN